MFANAIDFTAEDLRASDVLEDQIGNAASESVIAQLGAEWEKENRRALVLPNEEREPDENGRPRFAATYLRRKTSWQAANKKDPGVKRAMSISPDLAADEIQRYQRMPREQLLSSPEYQRRYNELEVCLGRTPTDFSRPVEAKESPDYEKAIAEFLSLSRGDRARLVTEIADRTLLGYVSTDDPDREIRATAQTRLLALATEA
jgi:hypothetical protein